MILANIDNATVVSIINLGRSKHTLAMHLMHCLFFLAAFHQFSVREMHVAGRLNMAADALS